MLQILGGLMMVTGGSMVSAFGYLIARGPVRAPVGEVGMALDRAYEPPAGQMPNDFAALLDRMP